MALTRITGKQIDFSNLLEAADDAAAALLGIKVGQLYRTGSILKVRIS